MNRSYLTATRATAVTAALAFMAGLASVAGPATTASANEPVTTSVATTPVASHLKTATKTALTKATTAKASTKTTTAQAAPKPAAPSTSQLHPGGIPSGQESVGLSAEQLKNARSIVVAGQKMGLPPRAWVIAIATSLQESKLENLGHLGASNDHDSLGLFQQRPTSGWGTPEQITNPEYSATAFYKGLAGVSGWSSMALTDAAQAVQVSAYPDAYAKWEKQAGELVQAFFGAGPYSAQAATVK